MGVSLVTKALSSVSTDLSFGNRNATLLPTTFAHGLQMQHELCKSLQCHLSLAQDMRLDDARRLGNGL